MAAPKIDFQHLLASAPDGILIAGQDGRILLVNDRVTSMFGYSADELVGHPVEVLIPEELREHHLAHREQYVQHPVTRPMGIHLELIGRRKDGSRFPVEISLSPTYSDGAFLVTAVIRDVTERRALETERERLRAELETERERQRIGMELHDGVMQAIYAVSLTLELASDDLESSPEDAKENVDRAIDQLHDVVRDIRSYIFDLRPREYTGDLATALINLGNEFRQNSQIETRVDISTTLPHVPDRVGIALYQVAHEALSNVRKHSRASAVKLSLRTDGSGLRLEVSDDGAGFDASVERSQRHRGLRNMVSRLGAIGGRVEVVSASGKGTTVTAEAPIGRDVQD